MYSLQIIAIEFYLRGVVIQLLYNVYCK